MEECDGSVQAVTHRVLLSLHPSARVELGYLLSDHTRSTCSLDIAPYVQAGQQFRFVKLTDAKAGKSNDSEWPGADVNAVGAIHTLAVRREGTTE